VARQSRFHGVRSKRLIDAKTTQQETS